MVSWTGLLLFLCSSCSAVLCCDWLENYQQLYNESQVCLQLMGGEMTKDEPPLPFPSTLYRRMERAQVDTQLVFIRDSLQLIFGLYCHGNRSAAAWDAVKSEHFLISIDRQIAELSDCVSTKQRVHRVLRRYYGKLRRKTLSRTGGSAESWELLRMETKLHLDQLQLLANGAAAAITASRGRHTGAALPGDCGAGRPSEDTPSL